MWLTESHACGEAFRPPPCSEKSPLVTELMEFFASKHKWGLKAFRIVKVTFSEDSRLDGQPSVNKSIRIKLVRASVVSTPSYV